MNRETLLAQLPWLLPKAMDWAESQMQFAARHGRPLVAEEQDLARRVGVARTESIRLVGVRTFPLPDDPLLRAAALHAGLLGPGTIGLTLGYGVFLKQGRDADTRLLAHEFRHVYQYEAAGSMTAFLSDYLTQIVTCGYAQAPMEIDARQHEG